MAVQYCEYFGIWNRILYSDSNAGNTSLHCGSNDRLPISTKSRISLPSDASHAAEPIDCSTMCISPAAISSFEASLWALAKFEAVVSIVSPGTGIALMSPIVRSIFRMFPCLAIVATCFISLVFSIMRASPASVPPPTPIPPMWRISLPSHLTNDVPVPIDTTIVWSSFDSKRAPSPSAINS